MRTTPKQWATWPELVLAPDTPPLIVQALVIDFAHDLQEQQQIIAYQAEQIVCLTKQAEELWSCWLKKRHD